MTNFADGIRARKDKLGEGLEETEGVPQEGFDDPTGEYPSRDYHYASSINKSAKGETINELWVGGGDIDAEISLPTQKPSLYPYNQVQETPSGHVIEYDDTPGGERILLKHRTGAGVELRADGSVVISSRNQKVEVTGGDHTTIVEGEGKLIYKGNLTLDVAGDLNMNVGGNYNLNVAGDKKEEIKGRHTKTVNLDQNYTIRGSRGSQVVKDNTETILGNNNVIVGKDHTQIVQNDTEILSGNNLITTAVQEWVSSSSTASVAARHISMFGHKGTIGGSLVDFYGKSYGGLPGGVTNVATFYGSLVGRATEAIHADYAMKSTLCDLATQSVESLVTGKELGGITLKPAVPKTPIMPYTTLAPSAPLPNPAVVEMHLTSSNYGIRNITIDSKLEDKILKSDDYDEVFNHDPSIDEIRSKLRDKQHYNNAKFTGYLVGQGKLNKDFKKNIPKNIGRSSSKKGTVRFGTTLIGNNPVDNRSKRFKVNTKK